MKHTLFIALLGATVAFTAPSLSYADNGYRANGGSDYKLDQKRQKSHVNRDRRNHKNNHRNKQQKFIAKHTNQHRIVKNKHRNKHGYNKHGYNKHGFNSHGYNRHGYNQHGYNKHGYNKHKQRHHSFQKNKPSFSISWNVGDTTIAYGNANDNDGYNQNYNNGYNNGHRKNRGKRIYSRIHNQANRIQHGINNGQLVKREVRKLRHEQRNIKQTLSHYKRDGHLNRYERNKLNQLLDIASGNIHRKSNNRLTRYSRHNNYYVQY